jgi:hypothetical protein
MGHRQVSADIGTSPERVFELYTDAQRLGDWQAGVKQVDASASLAEAGTTWTVRYGGPFTVKGTVLEVERPGRHRQRFSELLGLVRCTTTASFLGVDGGTRATFDFDYRVVGGPIGRLFDDMVGGEIESRFTKDLAGLKALAERTYPPALAGGFSPLERDVMRALLARDHPVLDALRRQFERSKVASRRLSGVGFFTGFDVPGDTPRAPVTTGRLTLSDVVAKVDGLEHGAGFVLFIEDGVLEFLEGFSYEEPWSDVMGRYEVTAGGVSYHGGSLSDLETVDAAWDRSAEPSPV